MSHFYIESFRSSLNNLSYFFLLFFIFFLCFKLYRLLAICFRIFLFSSNTLSRLSPRPPITRTLLLPLCQFGYLLIASLKSS